MDANIEQLWVRLMPDNHDHYTYVGTAYVPPQSSRAVYDAVINACGQITNKLRSTDDAFFFNDFNVPGLKWLQHDELPNVFVPNFSTLQCDDNDRRGDRFSPELLVADGMNGLGFYQLNNTPNSYGNVLDTVFATCHDNVRVLCPAPALCELIHTHMSYGSTNDDQPTLNESKKRYDFKRADYQSISMKLKQTNWDNITDSQLSLEDKVQRFYDHIYALLDDHVPIKSERRRSRPKPWLSPALARLRNQRRSAGRRAARSKQFTDIAHYHVLNDLFNERNKEAYQDYVREKGKQLKSDPSKFWSFIDEKRKRNDIPQSMKLDNDEAHDPINIANLLSRNFESAFTAQIDDDTTTAAALDFDSNLVDNAPLNSPVTEKEVLDALKQLNGKKGAGPDGIPPIFWKKTASFVHKPLTNIFQKSLSLGEFPSVWKVASVTPIFKSGDRSMAKNYRPISILSCLGKILEKLLCTRFTDSFRPLLSTRQHAYLTGRSTLTNLVEFTSYVLKTMENGEQVDSVYLDFSKAFDRINHNLLLA